MGLIFLDNTLQPITEDLHITTNQPVKQQTQHVNPQRREWYKYTKREREKNHTDILITCQMSSCFLGVWATFAYATVLFPENIMRTCQADITMTKHQNRDCYNMRAVSRDRHDNMPSWHCHNKTPCQDFCNTPNNSCILSRNGKLILPSQHKASVLQHRGLIARIEIDFISDRY